MLRALGCFGLALLFVVVSAKLRSIIWAGVVAFVRVMEAYSPFSFVVAVLFVFLVFIISLNRGSRPR